MPPAIKLFLGAIGLVAFIAGVITVVFSFVLPLVLSAALSSYLVIGSFFHPDPNLRNSMAQIAKVWRTVPWNFVAAGFVLAAAGATLALRFGAKENR